MRASAGGRASPRAVLFDVGGPINTEVEHERGIDRDILRGFAAAGRPVDEEQYRAAWQQTIDSFAPNAYQAVIWLLAERDAALARAIHSTVAEQSHRRAAFELRPGITALLAWLHGRGVPLGLAANQPAEAIARLDAAGVGRYFSHREVSGTHGFFKPDVRLCLRACADLGVQPADCVMVGDRIDNDVAPARLLGMGTALFRTGRHESQQPRSWNEVPDAEVRDVAELQAALTRFLQADAVGTPG